MDYLTKQTKLSKEEWDSIEVPLQASEKNILALIQAGFNDVNISRNPTPTLLHHMKITMTPLIELYIYDQYFEKAITRMKTKYLPALTGTGTCKAVVGLASAAVASTMHLKKADLIRLENTYKHIDEHKQTIFEFILLDLTEKMLKAYGIASGRLSPTLPRHTPRNTSEEWMFYYYTLHKLLSYKVEGCNSELRKQVTSILSLSVQIDGTIMHTMLGIGHKLIEKNEYLLIYADETLYDHQKQLFTLCKQPTPKLILYIAPTGTGKTMSPIGLAEKYRVIFVCAARHVGLALAKAAISVQRKIAFAFGCNDAEDIRLHYYAAKEYTVNQKSGGIGKVDNSCGEKVEIIISDVQSYLPAMLYMLAFNPKEKIIMYWDEPTITLDQPDHALHQLIQKNWRENLIPNVVLSSATLPQRHEIAETIADFCSRFSGAEVHDIVSYDCKKTIPLINREGFVEMPHYLYDDYAKIKETVAHCKQYKTLLRYIDLAEAIRFIILMEKQNTSVMLNQRFRVAEQFSEIETLNMYNIKMFYLNLLGNLQPEEWPNMYKELQSIRHQKYESLVNIVTADAHTLTDGPTIFLADDVNKVAQFYIQSANIPANVTADILAKINYNHKINEKVSILEKELADGMAAQEKDKGGGSDGATKSNDKKKNNEERSSPEMKQKKQKIEELKASIKMVMLNPAYVPNTKDHLYKYSSSSVTNAFTCDVAEHIVEQIMQISDIADYWKLLLMMGIGVFAAHNSTRYIELMKKLAQEHKLYMIIASTDYIYGTNYQLCHGYIGKDLGEMSQEKCIQAMGRVGRNKLQQNYSVRFRDNALLYKLFQHDDNKPEVINMNRLFCAGDTPEPPL